MRIVRRVALGAMLLMLLTRPGWVAPVRAAPIGGASAGSASAAGWPAANPAWSVGVQQQGGSPLSGLVGRTFTLCSWAGVPFEAVVEQEDWAAGPADRMRAVLVVRVAHDAGGATGAYITARLRDERGRTFEFARAGSGVDVMDLAREYGALTPTMPVQAGRPARHLWAFVVAPDVSTLTLDQAPEYRCP